MKFISSYKTTRYDIGNGLEGRIKITNENDGTMLEASVLDVAGQSGEEVIVFKGYVKGYNAAPLFGKAYGVLRDEQLCLEFWNEHILKIKEEQEND